MEMFWMGFVTGFASLFVLIFVFLFGAHLGSESEKGNK